MLVSLAFLSATAFAAGACPAGASGCFMCGEPPTGVPCSVDCTAHSVPGLGYVSCELPQGEPPVCYCPYGGGAPQAGDDDSLIANAPACTNPSGTCRDCGEIRASQGTVAIKRNGEWCIAGAGAMVFPGDKVWVREGGKARMMFSTGARVDANSNSVFTVQSLNLDPPPGATASMAWGMATGVYHYMISTDRIEQFEMRLDNAVIGIKGTEFLVEASSAQVKVKVLEGEVNLSRSGSSQLVSLEPGEYSTVSSSGGAPSAPVPFSPAGEDDWWNDLGPDSSSSCCGPAFVLLLVPLLAFAVKR